MDELLTYRAYPKGAQTVAKLVVDDAFYLPLLDPDTLDPHRAGALVMHPTDKLIYRFDGTNWIADAAASGGSWGTITGTLSSQTDLQTALDARELLTNKSTNTALGTSDTLYPTQRAVKIYVDSLVSSSTVPDGDKGDITVSGSGAVWTIDNLSVITAKLANLAVTDAKINDVAFGKITGITGTPNGTKFLRDDGSWQSIAAGVSSFNGRTGAIVPETNDYTWAQIDKTTSSLANLTTRSASDLNAGTLPAARFGTLTGDVTSIGYATTISNGAVTFAKIQNITSQTLLGRYAGTNGVAQEITIGANLTLDPDTGVLSAAGSEGGGSGTVNSGLMNRLAYYAANGTAVDDLAAITANRALISDANGLPTHSPVTNTELGYSAGVTSSIQTQLNSKLSSVTGTADRITITGGNVINIASNYAGQNTITTVGTIASGVWNGTAIAGAYGGTPIGGSTGQVLMKNSGSNYDYSWVTPSAGTAYSGTANRITISSGVVDIASTYLGQTSITTVGTILSGTWNGTPIASTYGGLPTGGTAGQMLYKSSSTNYAASWGPAPTLNYFAGDGILIDGENNISIDPSYDFGGIADGNKTDITVASTGTVWTINNNVVTTGKINALAVTDAKINDVAFSKITGITGTPNGTKFLRDDGSWQTVAGLSDGDKSDITVSSSGSVWTIGNNKITTAKLLNANVTDEKLASGINANKIGGGGVTNTAFGYISNLSSDAQTQINGKANRIRLSEMGIISDADLSLGSSTFGSDQTSALQTILNTASASAPLYIIWDVKVSTTGLAIKSYTTIEATEGSGMILRDGSDNFIFRTFGWTMPWTTIENYNITLRGGVWNGNGFRGGVERQERVREVEGMTTGFSFVNVRNLTLRDFTLINTRAFGILGCNMENVTISNFTLDQTSDPQINQDGIDLLGHLSNIYINNGRMRCGDERLIFVTNPPQTTYGFTTPYNGGDGDQTGIYIENIEFWGPGKGFRFNSTANRMDNVYVRNIWGIAETYYLLVENGDNLASSFPLEPGNGDFGTLTFENIHVEVPTNYPTDYLPDFPGKIMLSGDIESVIFRNLKVNNLAIDRSTICIGNPYSVGFTIKDLYIDGYTSIEGSTNALFSHINVAYNGNIERLRVNNVDIRHSDDNGCILIYNTEEIEEIQLHNIQGHCLAKLLYDSGTVGNISTTLVRHTGVTTGNSFYTGATINNIVLSNYFSETPDILGGTFTTQKGDAFAASGGGGTLSEVLTAGNTTGAGQSIIFENGVSSTRNFQMVAGNVADNIAMLTMRPTGAVNAAMVLSVVPSGTGFSSILQSGINIYRTDIGADPVNYEVASIRGTDDAYTINALKGGTGSLRPLDFQQNSVSALKINTDRSVTFNSAYTLPLAAGSVGQVLSYNGSGAVVWADAAGGGSSQWDDVSGGIEYAGTVGGVHKAMVRNASSANNAIAWTGTQNDADKLMLIGKLGSNYSGTGLLTPNTGYLYSGDNMSILAMGTIAFSTDGGTTNRMSISGTTGAVTFNTAYTMPTAGGANGQFLKYTTGGNVIWDDAPGAGSGTVTSVSGSGGTTGLTLTGGPITTSGTLTLGGILSIANGGTGTSTPGLISGTGISITGSWPNQTITATGGGGTTAVFTGATINDEEVDLTGTLAMSVGESGHLEIDVVGNNSSNNGFYVRKYIIPFRVTATNSITFYTHVDVVPSDYNGASDLTGVDHSISSNGSSGLRVEALGIAGQSISWQITVKKYYTSWAA